MSTRACSVVVLLPALVPMFAGSALPWPGFGYPNTHFWKEEGVTGNTHMNVMIDQNGSVYDIYYPSPGAHSGVAAENEGYAAPVAHPPGTTGRGQMNVEMLTPGIGFSQGGGSAAVYWFTNPAGNHYTGHAQSYVPDTNVLQTDFTFVAEGQPLAVRQYDFCPIGVPFPTTQGGTPLRGIFIKRILVTNQSNAGRNAILYFNTNFDINGSNAFDSMYYDATNQALVAYDNAFRNTNSSGEWNPLSYGSGYEKNVSFYFGVVGKVLSSPGSASGTPSDGNWRQAGSSDHDNGWIGWSLALGPNETREIDIAVIGAFETGAGMTGTWDYWGAPAAQWFYNVNVLDVQTATETWWRDWLAAGTTLDCPNDLYDSLFKRGLLASMLHVDGLRGGIIAGMHNGAYPYVWPRDCVYAQVSLDRTGHWTEGEGVFNWLRTTAYRANETAGRGFFYQKYTTDGHVIWNAPQVDETACVPWGAYYHYLCTGDTGFLAANWSLVWEAATYSSQDSTIDGRLRFEDAFNLMYSNNVWEDQWDAFLYSNAAVERGLRDAAAIAAVLGHTNEANSFTTRANLIHSGLDSRLAWGGENTDSSQLGLSVPFEVYPPNDGRMVGLYNRIASQLDAGGWLVSRYVGDTYWAGGPWWLTTLWMGRYEARRQDTEAGTVWLDRHLRRLDAVLATRGNLGLGAEQICRDNERVYPDFWLQTAYPNVWESMSTLVDAFMDLLDFQPNAPQNRFRIEPLLPSSWEWMTFHNVRVGGTALDITVSDTGRAVQAVMTLRAGNSVGFEVVLRLPAGENVAAVRLNGTPAPYTVDAATGRVTVSGIAAGGVGGTTTVNVLYNATGDAVSVWSLF